MRHYIVILVIAIVSAAFCSCELETSDNGDLDGMWHLVSVDTLSTSGRKDMSSIKIFWSFQSHLLQIDDKSGEHNSVLFRFEHNDGFLKIYNPYIYDRDNGDRPLYDVQMLMPFGVNALEENFSVDRLDGSKMTLSTQYLRLHFKKF